jgi:hypothetical protein
MAPRTEPPRDPSYMGSNSHTGLYSAIAIAVVLLIGFLIYAQYNWMPTIPVGDTTTSQPK